MYFLTFGGHMPDSVKNLLDSFRIAEAIDTQTVFELMNKSAHTVWVRDINGGMLEMVSKFTVGPFVIKKDDKGEFFIVGHEIERDRERHLRIVDTPLPGTVELRSPNEGWFAPSNSAIRIYIPK